MNSTTSCPLPSPKQRLSLQDTITTMATLPGIFWLKAILIAFGAAFIIGLPTVLIPNPIFTRMIPTRPIDYLFFVIAALLIGLTWALPQSKQRHTTQRQSAIGYITTFFAVGCPTCNKIILLLLGSGGAMNYFAPIQPLLGVISVILIFTAFHRQLRIVAQQQVNSSTDIPNIHMR